MADFIKYLKEHNELTFFKSQIADLSDFIKDIGIYTQIEVEQGELESLKTYIEECEKRLQSIRQYISIYEKEREKQHDKTEPQTAKGTQDSGRT